MSKQYNNAGRSLVVDEVIELKGSTRLEAQRSRQQIDLQLAKRDTAMIRAQIALIGSDSILTPSEKVILARELAQVTSSHGMLVSKAHEMGIEGQADFLGYMAAYQALSDFLQPYLNNMEEEEEIDPTILNQLFDNLYDSVSVIEERAFRHTTGMIGGLDYRVKFELQVGGSNGTTVPLDGTPVVLTVVLLREGEDVTSSYFDSSFTWQRVSSNRTADVTWREGEDLTGKTLTIDVNDLVLGSASFLCNFKYLYSDTMYYSKSGFITISKEVPGPAGEDAYQTQIISHNGTTFRMSQPFETVLEVRVWQGGEDITSLFGEMDFRWRRTSSDPHGDDVWNSAHYSTGGKMLTITKDDVAGKTNFFCDLLTKRS